MVSVPFVPHPGESLLGLVMRMSAARDFASVGVFLSRLGVVPERASRLIRLAEQADVLAPALGLDVATIQALGYGPGEDGAYDLSVGGFGGRIILRTALDLVHARVCPACLADDPVVKAAWDVPLIAVCPVHRCRLVDRCPGCGQRLATIRRRPDACRCGLWIVRWATELAAPEAVAMATRLLASLGLGPDGRPNLAAHDAMPFHELSRLIAALNMMHQPRGGQSAFSGKRSPRVEQLEAMLTTAGRMLAAWPESLHELCRRATPTGWKEQMKPPSIASGRVYRTITGMKPGLARTFLHEAWLRRPEGTGRTLPTGLVLLERRQRDGYRLLTGGEAMAILGIGRKALYALEREGRLHRKPPTERTSAQWDLDEVAALAKTDARPKRSPMLNAVIATALVGVTGLQRRHLRRCIQPDSPAPFNVATLNGAQGPQVVAALRARLEAFARAVPERAGDGGVDAGALIASHCRYLRLNMPLLLLLVLTGRLQPTAWGGAGRTLSDLLFDEQLLKRTVMAGVIQDALADTAAPGGRVSREGMDVDDGAWS